MTPSLSVVVPVHDEEANVAALAGEIAQAFAGRSYEMIFVDDASSDGTAAVLRSLKATHPALRVLRHGANAGQSRAIRTGVLAARAAIVVTLDGDGQNVPADAPRLVARLEASPAQVGMVGGRRIKRRDRRAKRWASLAANRIRKRLLNDHADDTGCGLKAMRREAFLRLPYFDHVHRYLPALMLREGYEVLYEDVASRPRQAGRSKYTNLGRLWASLSDLLGVLWLNRRARSPGEVVEEGS